MRKQRQRGFTIIELLVAIVIMTLVLAAAARSLSIYFDNISDQATADQLKTLLSGSQKYVRDQAAVLASTATPTVPAVVTIATLRTGGYVPAGYSDQNAWGQNTTLYITQPTAGNLQGMLVTSGGPALSGRNTGQIAQLVGAAGGEITSADTANVIGSFGGYKQALNIYGGSPGAGHVAAALFVASAAASTADDYLHRSATSGHPELNKMTTAIDMGSNALNTVSNVRMAAANQGMTFYGGGEAIAGSTDYGISFVTQSVERMRLFNDGHLWLNNGTTIQAPGGGNVISMAGSWLYGDTSNMALRPAANGGTVYLQGTASGGGTANLYVSGNTNIAGATNVNGLTSGAQITVNNGNIVTTGANTGWYNASYGGGFFMGDTWIRAFGDHGIYTGGQMQAGSIQSNGTLVASGMTYLNGGAAVSGRLTANEYFQVVAGANVGYGCSPGGLLGRDATGSQLVQCKNGVWSTMGGFSSYVEVNGPTVGYNQTGRATCPGGYRLISGGYQIVTTTYTFAFGPQSSRSENSTNSWVIVGGDPKYGSAWYPTALCAA